jgi:5-methyltetrahydropteroyltriglutamate--homocysteine methyltransferase
MKRSTDRILTTHAGSLPRPADLVAMAEAMQAGNPADTATYEAGLTQAVGALVREQAERGIDIVSDGDFGKPGFLTNVSERLSGFEVDPRRAGRNPWARSKEAQAFPDYYAEAGGTGPHPIRMVCTGPIAYCGHAQLERDIANFRAALDGVTVEGAFISTVSPATVEAWHRDTYYGCELNYLVAIAKALHEEYQAIVDAGFLLQVEDPGLLAFWDLDPAFFTPHHIDWSRLHVAVLNSALRGIAKEKIRFHTCYGINMGPRVHDMEMYDLFLTDVILQVHAGAFSFEAANPRHEHEWQLWEKVKLPKGAVLIPGVISNSTVIVEHPELVAQRICRFAKIAGRENVIAGADGGFANLASSRDFHASIARAKLQALAEGARIASEKLFPSPSPGATPPARRAGQRRRRSRTGRAAKRPARNPRRA